MLEGGSNYVIGWKVASLSANMASVRYRALLPLLALEQHQGCTCRVFADVWSERLEHMDALVMVKSFGADDLALVQRAVTLGLPVILDLCDNIFVPGYGEAHAKLKQSPAHMFLAMARHAKCIVVTTEPLADVVRARLGGNQIPIHVIPDGLESPELSKRIRERLDEALRRARKTWPQRQRRRWYRALDLVRKARATPVVPLAKLVAFRAVRHLHWRPWAKRAYRYFDRLRGAWRRPLQKPVVSAIPVEDDHPIDADAQRILWFGNHGAPYARFGMLDLLEIRDPLESVAKELKVELIVVSNDREKYLKNIKPLGISSTYYEWSAATVAEQLALASVVVVPSSRDEFSICKSANRTAMALMAGVPVVASSTPSLQLLRGCIVLDDFGAGLRRYLSGKTYAASDVQRSAEIIQREFGSLEISSRWIDVIGKAKFLEGAPPPDGVFVVVLSIPQDIDLAFPVIREAVRRNISVVVYCSTSLANRRPIVVRTLYEQGINFVLLSEESCAERSFSFPKSAKFLLTAAESNLGPHRFTRCMTDVANSKGLMTVTLQHGFDNIGLTYSDEFQPIEKINFSAQKVYIWGGLDTLHQRVSSETKWKCVPMGCPKPAVADRAALGGVFDEYDAVVGVFENLHWRRFSDGYRKFFIDSVCELAETFPKFCLLIKPHHAGRWLTERFKGVAPSAKNIIVADPLSPIWAPYTAPSLIGHCRAVITTPSTVAMDAARQGLPVAVVAHQMDLPRYSGLTNLKCSRDWAVFVEEALDQGFRSSHVNKSRGFVSDNILDGDAASRIVDDVSRCVERCSSLAL